MRCIGKFPGSLTASLGIQSFKVFLDSILYPSEPDSVGAKRTILEDFLKSQAPRKADKDNLFLSDLMQTWTFASTTSNDNLTSSVTAVLALLLRLLSAHLELLDYGKSLCHAILQYSQLRCVARSLAAPKHKEFVISPALRLLTEVVSFDGGSYARRLYSHREFTFDSQVLARNISARSEDRDTSRPSVRSNAIKYLLANLRYQNEGAKMDILKSGRITRALFQHVHDDVPSLIREILYVLEKHVVRDKEIARTNKKFLLDDRNLASILGICKRQDQEDQTESQSKSIQDLAFDFLLLVCVTPDLGVYIPQYGWCPSRTNQDTGSGAYIDWNDPAGDLGLDGIEWYESFKDNVPVRNTTLSSFIQILRPYAVETDQRLLLAIFKAAPELVADYFFKKATFSFDPNLTATWIGYASFVFSTIQIPVPNHFGRPHGYAAVPPPVSIAVESILPQPLTQNVLTKCLNQSSELIRFFAVRLLTIAFQKLKDVQEKFRQASGGRDDSWQEAEKRLVAEFSQRCPKMKDVIMLFRRIPDSNPMQQEAIARLLSLYYSVIPQTALEQHFDVAVSLTNALQLLDEDKHDDDMLQIRLTTLGHLLQIARFSPNMQWWKKPETLQFSPFTTLLRLAARSPDSSRQTMRLLETVTNETRILQAQTKTSALVALLASLKDSKDMLVPKPVFDFLDSCLAQFVRRSIKYEDDLEAMILDEAIDHSAATENSPIISLSLVTLVEQLPYVTKASAESLKDVVEWLARFLNYLRQAGEDGVQLAVIRDQMCESITATDCLTVLNDCFDRSEQLADRASSFVMEQEISDQVNLSEGTVAKDFSAYFEEQRPPQEDKKHPGLNRWAQKDVDDAIENGYASSLVLCLSAADQSIRLQATVGVRKLVAKLDVSIINTCLAAAGLSLSLTCISGIFLLRQDPSVPLVEGAT